MRQQAFCLCENKGADQLCGYCTADQCLCFRYIDIVEAPDKKKPPKSFWVANCLPEISFV